MRAAQINDQNIVINYAVVDGYYGQFLDPLNSVLGAYWTGTAFVNPPPPAPPVYPPDTPEQSYLEYVALIERRADQLEAEGDIVGAILLRESIK